MACNNKPKEEPDERDVQLLTSYILNPGKSMAWHAQQLGIDRSTVLRRWGAFGDSEWFQKLVPQLQELSSLAFRNIAMRLAAGDYDATRDYLRGLGIYSDKHKHEIDLSNPDAVRSLFAKIPAEVLDQLDDDESGEGS